MTDTRVVLMTAPLAGVDDFARALVDERLAACVNVVRGVTSVYRWEGAIERVEDEVLLVAKTHADRVDALIARAVELHPYTVPEVLALPVEAGFTPYLDWVRAETRAGGAA